MSDDMSFQGGVGSNGTSRNQRTTAETGLRADFASSNEAEPEAALSNCGFLSRTVIESPRTRWILPVRLRSKVHVDVAFIGDHFVQISEIKVGGELDDIARKIDFGARIRNAAVLGEEPGDGPLHHLSLTNGGLKTEASTQDALFEFEDPAPALPPQMLLVMLETGVMIILFIRESPGRPCEFITSTIEKPERLKWLGLHLAVDPSSRYIAAADPEGFLVVHELESFETLERQYRTTGSFKPVRQSRYRLIQGLVHNMVFLYPRREDADHHIILQLIVVQRAAASRESTPRCVIFDWTAGDPLTVVFADESPGYKMPPDAPIPLLVIPLRFQNSYLSVSERSMGIVHGVVSGMPQYDAIEATSPVPTGMHDGLRDPLWVAWTKPYRGKWYTVQLETVCIVREDGLLLHMEIDPNTLMPNTVGLGSFDTKVSTAFTAASEVNSDAFIIGSDSGFGGIWKLEPRVELVQVNIAPNWSPVLDIATTDTDANRHAKPGKQAPSSGFYTPDRIFTVSANGSNGMLTEHQWGFRARIGLDIDLGQPARQIWAFPHLEGDCKSLRLVVALPDSSIVLKFSADMGQIREESQEEAQFDTRFRTIFASKIHDEAILQVTESSVVLITPSSSRTFALSDLLKLADFVAESAHASGEYLVVASHQLGMSRLHILSLKNFGDCVNSWEVPGDINGVFILGFSDTTYILACCHLEGASRLLIYTLEGEMWQEIFPTSENSENIHEHSLSLLGQRLDAFTSICSFEDESGNTILTLGTRCGHFVTAVIPPGTQKVTRWRVDRLGGAPVVVFQVPLDTGALGQGANILASCDGSLLAITGFLSRKATFQNKARIIPTDLSTPGMASSAIHSVYPLKPGSISHTSHLPVIMLSDARLLVGIVSQQSEAAPRIMPLPGVPSRVIYSQTWGCLIIGMTKDNKTMLEFVDPNDGSGIAQAIDKNGNITSSISGLGRNGDRIHGLYEWFFVKEGSTFPFILVATNDGNLILVSVKALDPSDPQPRERNGARLKYWTRYKRKGDSPIYSVLGDDEGILYCAGQSLHWDVLDLTEKRLKPVKEFPLDSPVTSLRIENGRAFALTALHSVYVLDYKSKPDRPSMTVLHSDAVSRSTMHMINVGPSSGLGGAWPISLIAGYKGHLSGVRIAPSGKEPILGLVFDAKLRNIVRRFARTKCLPYWAAEEGNPKYGKLKSTPDNAEIIGVSVNGAIQHFTLLDHNLWRFLSFIQNLAWDSKLLWPHGHAWRPKKGAASEATLEARKMHIDGDLLRRCFDLRALDNLITMEADVERFCRYLDQLEGGIHTEQFRIATGDRDEFLGMYLELGYEVLHYLTVTSPL